MQYEKESIHSLSAQLLEQSGLVHSDHRHGDSMMLVHLEGSLDEIGEGTGLRARDLAS